MKPQGPTAPIPIPNPTPVSYRVRWARSTEEREQQTDFPIYPRAEAYFISLLAVIDRRRGGWAELWSGERLVLDVGQPRQDPGWAAPVITDTGDSPVPS